MMTPSRWMTATLSLAEALPETNFSFRIPSPSLPPNSPTFQGDTRCADAVESAPDPAGHDLEAIWQTEWEENLRAAALQKLQTQVKAKHYQIYVLHVIQEKPAREVATLLGTNGATVYVVKHRLSRLLREIVRKLEREPG